MFTHGTTARSPITQVAGKVALFVCLSMLAGCGGIGAAGQLGQLRQVAKTCPSAPVSAYVGLDARSFLRAEAPTEARVATIERLATRVAVCGGGRLQVVAFGPSPAATAVVFDDQLHPEGATENSRLLRVGSLVRSALVRIRSRLAGTYAQLTRSGADPVAQLQLARDFADELPSDVALEVLIESSGPPRLFTPSLTTREAAALARRAVVPRLSRAAVVFAGVGKTGRGAPPPTHTIDVVRAYLMAVCGKTGASCRTTTAMTIGGPA